MVTEKEVKEKLKECYDPEIPINIVDLGLIYEIKIKKEQVYVKMTLTSPFCPMTSFLQADVKSKLESLKGVKEGVVDIVWDPPWTPERISEAAKAQLGV